LEAWRMVGFWKTVKVEILAVLGALAVSVPLDSFFWEKLIWPEGVVLWFNTVRNQSHLWGTEPFSWYFQHALGKAVGLPVVLGIFLPWADKQCQRVFLLWVFIPVLSLSFLPHKELRFIFPSIWALFVVLSLIASQILKKFPGRLSKAALGFIICGNLIISGTRLAASYHNYPGAQALLAVSGGQGFPRRISPGGGDSEVTVPGDCRVHFGAYAAINGISRFLHPRSGCSVDPSQTRVNWEEISVALVEEVKGCPEGFELAAGAPVFDRFSIKSVFPFLVLETKPGVGVCIRNKK